ncbi:MAG: A/G-specific adenine glycosylase [Patescibacteria group bacterium]
MPDTLGTMRINRRKVTSFNRTLYAFFRRGRRDLPWRRTANPYCILVSEVMLQQTQVPRVVGKYREFLRTFPTIRSLAAAPLPRLIRVWQGMGYNRRALYLRRASQDILKRHRGRVPHTVESLSQLPGIGVPSASAIAVYAYNQPVAFIETNVRAVFIHHFFPRRRRVHDREILPLVAAALDRRNPRRWYQALMDYGTWLKRTAGNASRRSAHYVRQSRFEGSRRQIRGRILRSLVTGPMTRRELIAHVGSPWRVLQSIFGDLAAEGFVLRHGLRYALSSQ